MTCWVKSFAWHSLSIDDAIAILSPKRWSFPTGSSQPGLGVSGRTRPRRPRPAHGTTTARERPSGESCRTLPPRLHMLAIPGSSKPPHRRLKTSNQSPPEPRNEKEPEPSQKQSVTKTERQPRVYARRVTIFSLSQVLPPHPPCPILRRFHVETAARLWALWV